MRHSLENLPYRAIRNGPDLTSGTDGGVLILDKPEDNRADINKVSFLPSVVVTNIKEVDSDRENIDDEEVKRIAEKYGAYIDEKRTMVGHRDELLQNSLRAFLQVGIGCRSEKRITAQRASGENGKQCVFGFGSVELLGNPFHIVFRTDGKDIMLYYMDFHKEVFSESKIFCYYDFKII